MQSLDLCGDLHAGLLDPAGPLGKLIVFGYYDGPTDGVALCAADTHAYRFSLIGWNKIQERRLFTFSRLNTAAFGEIADLVCRVDASPRWPVWVPKWQTEGAEMLGIEARLAALLAEADPATLIVLSDSLPRIEHVWPVTPEMVIRLKGLPSGPVEAWKILSERLPDPNGNLRRSSVE